MGELINGRTPEEIKKRLLCCSKERGCYVCPDMADSGCSLKLCADALAYIEQLEETIALMQIQMRGDCGCCKHGRDMARCNKCLTEKEYHPLWEYEGLPEVKKDDQSV